MFTAPTVPSEEYATAASFLDALDVRSWTVGTAWSCPWVFRGQRDALWKLTPTAWRGQSTIPLKRLAQVREKLTEEFGPRIRERLQNNPKTRDTNADYVVMAYSQARAEFSLLLDFVQLADELGYRVPSIESYLRLAAHDYLPDVQNYPLVRFLPEPNAAMALAQHHGVPTRSLDWTRNPLHAAYFAASEVESPHMVGSMSVWALRPDLLKELGRAEQYNSSFTRFLDHTAPTSENPYLLSQEGLFIHPTYGCAHVAKTGQFPCLETFAMGVQGDCSSLVIRKLTLPCAEVGELLRLLWLKGVSRAHLMPVLDNVTHALSAKWKWAT
jgi:FRG domain